MITSGPCQHVSPISVRVRYTVADDVCGHAKPAQDDRFDTMDERWLGRALELNCSELADTVQSPE